MHVIIWDQNRCQVPARFHCEKVKLLGLLRLEAGASRTCSGRPRTGAVPTKRTVLVNPVLHVVRTNQTRPKGSSKNIDIFLEKIFVRLGGGGEGVWALLGRHSGLVKDHD